MTRRWLVGTVLLLLVSGLALAVRAEDDEEPTFLDKKLSYWTGLLTEGKDGKARQRGLIGVEQIGHYGSRKVVPALVKAMREDKDDEVRTRAARAVGRACAKALEQARSDKKDELPRFDDARDSLTLALRTDKADGVREAAAAALGDMGSDARNAAGALGLALKDKHAATVTAAATALRRMGKDARDAETELTALVGNDKAEVEARTEAAVALGQIRADVAAGLPTMRKVLADEKASPKVRRAVADALGKWGKEAAASSETLAAVLIEKAAPDDLRLAALTALEAFGTEAKAAVPALVRAVEDKDRIVRCLAMQAVGKLTEVLEDRRKDAVKAVLKATQESNIEVCVTAIDTLGALAASGFGEQQAEVIRRLEEILKREGRKAIREAATAARAKAEPKKKEEKKE